MGTKGGTKGVGVGVGGGGEWVLGGTPKERHVIYMYI